MRSKMHPATLLLCLALAGCASADAAGPQQTSSTTPAPSGHNARASANPNWWKEGGVTREKINAMCWMKYEEGRNSQPVERRADLVAKCVAETLKTNPPGR